MQKQLHEIGKTYGQAIWVSHQLSDARIRISADQYYPDCAEFQFKMKLQYQPQSLVY